MTLALIALPTMLAQGYRPSLAAGTVGIILPPAVMLFFLAGQFGVSIGHMFLATLLPGAVLVGLYLVYYVATGVLDPPRRGVEAEARPESLGQWLGFLTRGLVLPVGLVSLVLGSIIFGWATPPQSGAIGAAGGLLLMVVNRRFSRRLLLEVVETTVLMVAMVFFIIIAAVVFSYPFRYFGGDEVIANALAGLDIGAWGTLVLVVSFIFVLGFFIDWIEITVITLPLFAPVLAGLDFSGHKGEGKVQMLWMATLVALTLQTSFLTPPFGFALFFLKGAAPPVLPQGRGAAGNHARRYLSGYRADRGGPARRHRPAPGPAGDRGLVAGPGVRILTRTEDMATRQNGVSPDDFSMRLVAIVSLGAAADGAGEVPFVVMNSMVTRHGGVIVESSPERLLATFGRLDAATAFARAVQEGGQSSDQAPLAIGINLGALSGTESERDIAFADRLRGRAGPGEICISAVTSDRLTSRFRPGRKTTIPLWRICLFSGLALFGFLGYFLGWFYAIYLQVSNLITDGAFACWPEFMCR